MRCKRSDWRRLFLIRPSLFWAVERTLKNKVVKTPDRGGFGWPVLLFG
jgi:hypothetical protein